MVVLPLRGMHGSKRELGLQGAVCNASCREQATLGRLDLLLFVLRKHFGDIKERRTSPPACCQHLPALLEDSGKKRK